MLLHRFLLLALLFVVNPASASTGDRLVEFRQCVSQCIESQKWNTFSLPCYMKLLRWDLASDCDYQCQHIVTQLRVEKGLSVEQFHGKWPFVRILGAQEPMSVIFSILNFLPHLQGFRSLRKLGSGSGSGAGTGKSQPVVAHTMQKFYMAFAVVGMNAWLWSAVFHTRDFLWTERLDYFSAMGCIIFGLYVVIVRAHRLDLPQNYGKRLLVSVVLGAAYLAHVSYLQFVHFSYTYNMAAGVVFGLLGNIQWIAFSLSLYNTLNKKDSAKGGRSSTSSDNKWALRPIGIVLCITAGMAFELFDFAPIGWALDAHSLWHAATVIPTYQWYSWMHQDLRYLSNIK